ncbi:hypothetical protein [Saezia sanguinis]|uniref:hypothetical protein n=1 Tax=Saezia sanguinis TaxID=1965230 RepID=UPI0030324FF3
MTPINSNQLVFNFDPTLADRFQTSREYLDHLSRNQKVLQKVIAMDMDMSPSALSRKLNPKDGDCQRFNVDDMDAMFRAYPAMVPQFITYLVSKYCDSPKSMQQRIWAEIAKTSQRLNELAALAQTHGEES